MYHPILYFEIKTNYPTKHDLQFEPVKVDVRIDHLGRKLYILYIVSLQN